MAEQVFVISDLHLGGEPGFQMCSPRGQALLASFTRWVTAQQQPGRDAHIVVAGDGVDFLAENPSLAFTIDEGEAVRKLNAIFEHTKDVWDAFHDHVAAGGKFTLMLGNHDIELSLPKPRRLLLERLGVGRVEILYDDEALRIGELLIEHGNRYDDWNWVDHDQLRRVRRNLSRGEAYEGFKPQPGSRFVIDVIMNAMKKEFPFVDLLKPETESVLPFMALLRPSLASTIKDAARTMRETIAMKIRATAYGGDSTRASTRASDRKTIEQQVDEAMEATEEALALVDQLAETPEQWQAREAGESTRSIFGLFGAKENSTREVYIEKLRKVLVARLGTKGLGFHVNIELPMYLEAAKISVANGAEVVVYGHTHLVKRKDMARGGRYLNTGTWADLMRVPVAALSETPTKEAMEELDDFAYDLGDPKGIERWRLQVPTFARVDVADDLSVRSADVFLYREGGALDAMKIPDGPIAF